MYFFQLKSTHSMRSATGISQLQNIIFLNLNPRTPCGVRRKAVCSLSRDVVLKSTHSMRSATCQDMKQRRILLLKSTHSMRSATAILYRNIVFLHRLHLFFWTNCFVSKNIIVFSRVSLFLTGANLPVFSCLLPIRTILIP